MHFYFLYSKQPKVFVFTLVILCIDCIYRFPAYLACKSEAVESLLAFPAVAKAFKESNSTLPTSVSSERLFSTASQILTDRRAKMSDDVIDKLAFLRSVDRADLK